MRKEMKYVGKLFSLLAGCIMLLLSVVALLDPVGTKMADDNDPFGDPGGPLYAIFLILVSAGWIFWPLAVRIYKERRSSRGEREQKVQVLDNKRLHRIGAKCRSSR
jgi:hypothetical protein